MKNFPHQFSDPMRIRASLETIRDLKASGTEPADENLGPELARRRIYRFRGGDSTRANLAAELRKPPGDRGTYTAAREMRRTLRLLGWIDSSNNLTRAGRQILAEPAGTEDERALWRSALVSMTMEDDGNRSHPTTVLLRLISERPLAGRDGMELAFEARDDTDGEFRRLVALQKLASEARRRQLGLSRYKVDDARKVLPALAEYAGLIERPSRQHPFNLTGAGRVALGRMPGQVSAPTGVSRRRGWRFRGARRRVSRRSTTRRRARRARRSLTAEEQAAAEQLLYERTDRHEELVDCMKQHIPAGPRLFDDSRSYDLVAISSGRKPVLLFEMKTLETDQASQTRRAVGQLLFYEHVVLSDEWPGRSVVRAAVFESAIADELSAFLQSVGIAALWCDRTGLHPLNRRGRRLISDLQAL